jgi:GH18 family chitinase
MTKEEFKIEKLVEMRNELDARIQNYKDGYFYICNVRSYGRNWKETHIHNTHTLQELCYRYDGQDGIVDVYSNNPYLKVDNYGDVMFVPTIEDYEKWLEYTTLSNSISNAEKELDKWDNRGDTPFMYRTTFAPLYTREDLEEMKSKLANYDMSFVVPVLVKCSSPDEEEQ